MNYRKNDWKSNFLQLLQLLLTGKSEVELNVHRIKKVSSVIHSPHSIWQIIALFLIIKHQQVCYFLPVLVGKQPKLYNAIRLLLAIEKVLDQQVAEFLFLWTGNF